MIRDGMNKKIDSRPHADLSGVEPVVELMLRLTSRGANVIQITSTKTAGEMCNPIAISPRRPLHGICLTGLLKEGHLIHYMVMGDREMLKARNRTAELTNVPVTSPHDLLSLKPLVSLSCGMQGVLERPLQPLGST